jgi:hypothetical protein
MKRAKGAVNVKGANAPGISMTPVARHYFCKELLVHFEPVFVDLEGSNLRFQSRGRNAELGCGTR